MRPYALRHESGRDAITLEQQQPRLAVLLIDARSSGDTLHKGSSEVRRYP